MSAPLVAIVSDWGWAVYLWVLGLMVWVLLKGLKDWYAGTGPYEHKDRNIWTSVKDIFWFCVFLLMIAGWILIGVVSASR
jgi:hypothetical protein